MPNTKRSSSGRLGISFDQQWTKSRCNRLLRPLTLSLASLSSTKPASHCVPAKKRPNGDLKSEQTTISGENWSEEAEWLHSNPRKRQRLTYGGRTKRLRTISGRGFNANQSIKATSHVNRGEIVASTPFLSKAHSNYVSYDLEDQQSLNHDDALKMCAVALTPGNAAPRGRKMDSLEAFKVAFRNLLKQTNPPQRESRTNSAAPSLFRLCLRNIPAHIAEEEEWRKEQDPDDKSDPAADVYEFLESLGCGDLEGWRHLRLVVRAHGEFLVQNCIKNKTLQESHIRAMLKICIQENSLDEAKRLLQCWIENLGQFVNPISLEETSLSLLDLLSMVTDAANTANFQCRMLRELFESGSLPMAWVVTPAFKPTWHRLILSSSKTSEESTAAIDLLCQILFVAADLHDKTAPFEKPSSRLLGLTRSAYKPRIEERHTIENTEWESALSNTVTSLCTILTAIACSRIDMKSGHSMLVSSSKRIDLQILARTSEAFREGSTHDELRKPDSVIENRLIICAAELLLALNNQMSRENSNEDAVALPLKSIIKLDEVYESCLGPESGVNTILSRFFCSVAHCYKRIDKKSAFELFQHTIGQMISYQPSTEESDGIRQKHFLQKLALDVALQFADNSSDKEHVLFAGEIERQLGRSKLSKRSKQNHLPTQERCSPPKAMDSGLRWEEGICEWVAATPASMIKSPGFLSLKDFSPFTAYPEGCDTSPQHNFSPISDGDSRNSLCMKRYTDAVLPRSRHRGLQISEVEPFSTPGTELTETISDGKLEGSGICMDEDKENILPQEQSVVFEKAALEDCDTVLNKGDDEGDDEDEDELAMPSFASQLGEADDINSSLLGMRLPGCTDLAYAGIRHPGAIDALDSANLLSDELG